MSNNPESAVLQPEIYTNPHDCTEAVLMLDNGHTVIGKHFGAPIEKGEIQKGEVVFNTSPVGYPQILTDPSYRGQIVLMTHPMIGSYGIDPRSLESDRIWLSAFIVRQVVDEYSHHLASVSVSEFLEDQGIPGISEVDTRMLVRGIVTAGSPPLAVMACVNPGESIDMTALRQRLTEVKTTTQMGEELVNDVATKQMYDAGEVGWNHSHRFEKVDTE
jgi:carbamoyl-phosphate synthase small subunit